MYTSVEPSAASAGDTRTRITRKKQRSFFIYLSPPKTLYQKAEAESNTKRCNEPPLAGAERGGEEVTEMEFLKSLNKEQAEYYAKTLDELCEMLPKKPEQTWEDAGKTEQQVQHRKMVDAEIELTSSLLAVEELTERIRQAVTTLKTAKKLTNIRDEESGTGFGYVPKKVKAGIEIMWVAHRDLEFCVNRMRMLLGESEILHREWVSEVKKANGHGQ